MIVGNKERFAIEVQIDGVEEGWVLGRLRFWLCSLPVGNWEDVVDLNGCAGWLRDFYENPRDRFEPGLFDLSPEDVFAKCYDPVFTSVENGTEPVPNAYSRFHISFLGMSSFERFDILLLKNEQGLERCLWRQVGESVIHECPFSNNEMERIAENFCLEFQDQVNLQ